MYKNNSRNAELHSIIRLGFKNPTQMNHDVVKWFRQKKILKGKQRHEEIRCEPWVFAAIDRGLGDSELTARFMLEWFSQLK